ncbi:MAG: septum formation initiator family protein [Candidatus Paceibacterota bacterium]
MLTNSNQSGKVKRGFFNGVLALIILVLLGLLGYSNWQIFQRRREVKAELKQLNRKIDALKQEEATIQATLNEKDDYVVEEIAREQLNLKKPGEKVIDIKRPPQKEEEKEQQKWWQKWLKKIKFWE